MPHLFLMGQLKIHLNFDRAYLNIIMHLGPTLPDTLVSGQIEVKLTLLFESESVINIERL